MRYKRYFDDSKENYRDFLLSKCYLEEFSYEYDAAFSQWGKEDDIENDYYLEFLKWILE